jgi:chaperonin GroES
MSPPFRRRFARKLADARGPHSGNLRGFVDLLGTREYSARAVGSPARRVPSKRARLSASAEIAQGRDRKLESRRTCRGALRRTLAMKIRPLQDRILIKRVDEEQKTAGGIIIPDTAKEKPQEGRVVAVGNGKIGDDGKVRPLDVKKGDRVLFSKYAGSEVKLDGEEHMIIREEDVLGVIE